MSDPTIPYDATAAAAAAPPKPRPVDYLAAVLAAAAALLLASGVLLAFAQNASRRGGQELLFRLLGQAAHPFTALLTLVAAAIVIRERHDGHVRQRLSGLALGVATVVSLALALLALNGIVTDVTAASPGLFKLASVLSRLATVVLAGAVLWLAATAPPAPKKVPLEPAPADNP